MPLYLVALQIHAFEADASVVAHGDEHRIRVLKLWTL